MLDEFAVGFADADPERGEPEHVGGRLVGRQCPGHVVEPRARGVGVDQARAGGVEQDVPPGRLAGQLAGRGP